MIRKETLKKQVVALRKNGLSYSEILKQVPVAKSTVSLWLRDVGLSKQQHQRLTEKKIAAIIRGGQAKKAQRLQRTKDIYEAAEREVGRISKEQFWILGVGLYWAEGSKEKEHRPGTNLTFNNSDPAMIKVFLKWLIEVCKVNPVNMTLEIYIHKNSINQTPKVQEHWLKVTGFPIASLQRVYYKQNKIRTNRKNVGNLYYGTLRVKVNASSALLRRVAGWTRGIVRELGK
jgi:hypothetical protein